MPENIEQATAAPGEKRNVKRPKKRKKNKRARRAQ